MPLGDLCEFQRGLTYAKSDEVEFSGNVVLRATNIDLATNLLNLSELRYIKDSVSVPDSKRVKRGSLIICTASGSKSHLGKVAYIDADYGYAFGGFMGMLTPKSAVLPKYLFHLMTSDTYRDFIAELSDGANINNLKFDDLKQFRVPICPLPEQQRIVAVLDEAFDGIATAKANAEKNLQNARALLESYLQDIFSARRDGWVEKRLGDISGINYGYTQSACEKEIGPKFLRITDIRDDGVDWSTVPSCEIEPDEIPRFKLADEDIVFARTGATTGKSFLVTNPPDAVFASYLIRVRMNTEEVLPQFVNLFFRTRSYWETIRTGVAGAAQGGFNATKLGGLLIPFPSSQEQQLSIVSELRRIAEKTHLLESLSERKLVALDDLKKSLLHQAFSGHL
jgi:type I restriction enzyme S subunit